MLEGIGYGIRYADYRKDGFMATSGAKGRTDEERVGQKIETRYTGIPRRTEIAPVRLALTRF